MIDLFQLKELAKNISVLYVEDEDMLRESITRYLHKFFIDIDTALNGMEGIELYKKNSYDLVITDIKMPKLDGIEMSKEIKTINENQNILIISAHSEIFNFSESIRIGIDGYVLKPIDFEQLNSALYKIVYKIKQFKENEEYKNNLEKLVEKKTIETKHLEEEKVKNYKKTLYALVKMIEDRDTYTGGHSQRVASYSKMIAISLGLSDETCENIYQAGILHDIGKIAIPDTILLKPGTLSEIEYKFIQEHVNIGVDMLNRIPMFKQLSLYIQGHHERFDGSGYPNKLKGDEILLESQIMAIADTFDAMTTSRIYKVRKSTAEAIKEIKSLTNIHYTKELVDCTAEVLKEVFIDETINQLPNSQFEQERFSYFYKDQTTQSYNSSYLDLILTKNSYSIKYKYLYLISVHNLEKLNNTYGWEEGDKYLKNVSQNLQDIYTDALVFRVYSDDFLILSQEIIALDEDKLAKFICIKNMVFSIKKIDIVENKIFSLHDFNMYM